MYLPSNVILPLAFFGMYCLVSNPLQTNVLFYVPWKHRKTYILSDFLGGGGEIGSWGGGLRWVNKLRNSCAKPSWFLGHSGSCCVYHFRYSKGIIWPSFSLCNILSHLRHFEHLIITHPRCPRSPTAGSPRSIKTCMHWFLLTYQSLDWWFELSLASAVSICLLLLCGFALVKFSSIIACSFFVCNLI